MKRFLQQSAHARLSIGQAVAALMAAVMFAQPILAQSSDPSLVQPIPISSYSINLDVSWLASSDLKLADPIVPPPTPPVLGPLRLTKPGDGVKDCPQVPSSRIFRDCSLANGDFEKNIVNSWLAIHGLPDSAASVFYQYGRSDWRDQIRAAGWTFVATAILKDPSARTEDEKAIVEWLQEAVRINEIAYYKAAQDEYNQWQNSGCKFRLDADIASQLSITYDPIPACFPSAAGLLAGRPVPNADYFKMSALKKVYGRQLTDYGDGVRRANESLRAASILAASVAGLAAAVASGIIAYVGIFYSTFAAAVSLSVGFFAPAVAGLLPVWATLAAATGPAAIVLLAVAIGVSAAITLSTNQQNSDAIGQFLAGAATAANPPDVKSMLLDSVGNTKLYYTFIGASLPERASTLALPAADSSARFYVTSTNGPSGLVTNFSYQRPNSDGSRSVTGVRSYQGRYLLQSDDQAQTSFGISLDFLHPVVDNNPTLDEAYSAALISDGRWQVTRRDAKDGDITCSADSATGLTPTPIDAKCRTFTTNQLRIRRIDSDIITVRVPQPPVFTGQDTALFNLGQEGSFFPQLTAASNGLPCALSASGSLPAGLNFTNNAFRGSPSQTGTFAVNVTANCGGATSSRTFNIRVVEGFRLVWPTATTEIELVRGRAMQFTIRPNKSEPAGISYDYRSASAADATFPAGMTPTLNADGSLTVSGIPTAVAPNPGTLTVDYFGDKATWTPKYRLLDPTLPQPAALTTVTWVAGQQSIFSLDGLIANVPVTWRAVSLPDTRPAGLSRVGLRDFQNNTGQIEAFPDPLTDSGKTVEVLYTFTSPGDTPAERANRGPFRLRINVVAPTPNLTVTDGWVGVNDGRWPFRGVIDNRGPNGRDAGVGGTYRVLTPLPTGLVATAVGSARTQLALSGTTTAPGGIYPITIEFANNGGTIRRDFKLAVLEPAGLADFPDRLIVYTGIPLDVSLPSSKGFPRLAIKMPLGDGLGTSIGTMFDLASRDVSALASNGIIWDKQAPDAAGRLRLTGTPLNPATYNLRLNARTNGIPPGPSRGVGEDALKNFTLVVVRPADLNNDGTVDCRDLAIVKDAFGSIRGQAKYVLEADTNRDGVINILDLSFVQSRLPKGTTCP